MLTVGAPHGRDRGHGPLLRSSVRDDTHELAVLRALALALDLAVLLGEQRVVTADADVGAGVETRAALAHDDVARENLLAAVDFDA